MNSILFLIGVLVFLAVAGPVVRVLIALVAGGRIGAQALAGQPDRIHLAPAPASSWKSAPAADSVARALAPQGFADAGGYSIAEMPGVRVRLFAHPAESFYAAWYEHPQAPSWLEFVTRYQDGTGSCVSNMPATGLAPLAGNHELRVTGLSPLALLARARAERPGGPMRPADPASAARDFEEAYADALARRRAQGVSRGEVVRVAAKKAA